jgi:hypothetical protein
MYFKQLHLLQENNFQQLKTVLRIDAMKVHNSQKSDTVKFQVHTFLRRFAPDLLCLCESFNTPQ